MIRALAVPRTPGASIEYSILSDNEETTEFAIDKDTGIVKLWHVIVHWTEKNKKLMMYVILVNHIKFFAVPFLF